MIQRFHHLPIYKQIAQQIRQKIESGEFSEKQRLPSSRQLAETFKVNHLTIRQALKMLEAEHVISIQHGRGAFVARESSRVRSLALILPSLGQEQSGIISETIRQKIGTNFKINVLDYHQNPEEEINCLQRIRDEKFDCAIIYPRMSEASIRPLLKLILDDFPMVLIDRFFTDIPGCYVSSDNFSGGLLATRHLIERGCKRVACVTDDVPNVNDRFKGYREALLQAGQKFDPSLVLTIDPQHDEEGATTRQLLQLPKRPDGIFYCNDYEALFGLKAIQKAGLRVPNDIRIVGFDDIKLAKYTTPSLSTIRQDHEAVATKAVELLALQLNKTHEHHKILVPVQLVERSSSA